MSIDLSLVNQITNVITKINLLNNKTVTNGNITVDSIYYTNFAEALQNYLDRNVYTENISNITSTTPKLNEIKSRDLTIGFLETLIQDDIWVKTKYNYSLAHDIRPSLTTVKDNLNEKLYTEILSLIHKIIISDINKTLKGNLSFASSVLSSSLQTYAKDTLYDDLVESMKNKDIDLLARNIEYLFKQNESNWMLSGQNILTRLSNETMTSSRIAILNELQSTLYNTIQIITKYNNIKSNYLSFDLGRILLGLYDKVDFYFQIQEETIKDLLTTYCSDNSISADFNSFSRFSRVISNSYSTYDSYKSSNSGMINPSENIAKQIFNSEKVVKQL